MKNYYKYLPVSEEDENWGVCVLNAGCSRITANESYPPKDHPSHHYFDWSKGRVLQDEYQLIYITRGEGIFESESLGKFTVNEGTAIILFPNEWHRFKPKEEKGWDEYWVGFHGNIIDNLRQANFFRPQEAAHVIGVKEEVLHNLMEVIEQTKYERSGYQPLISGAVMHLLGQIHSIIKESDFAEQDMIENIVSKARVLLRENVESNISIEDIAEQLNVGYSWFRKSFKTYTGIAPGQYMIQLKIEKAKALLNDNSKSIKQIAHELHFDSCFYFSKLFKDKTGLSPEKYRENL